MNEDLRFLSVDDVLRIHRRMIDEFGGSPHVRDTGLLHSAVFMPAARYGGEPLHQGLPAMAAAYLFHLCSNHPFVDGNKRTALAAAEMFLLLNHGRLTATDDELEGLTMGVAAGRTAKADDVAFMEQHVE